MSWPGRLLLLFFSLHLVFFAWAATGGLGAAAGGTPLALGASVPVAAYGVWRCLTCEVIVGTEEIVVRNRWRTHRLPRSDVTGMRSGLLLLVRPSPAVLVLEVSGERRVKLDASVSPTREGRRAAVRVLAGSGISGHRLHAYVDGPLA